MQNMEENCNSHVSKKKGGMITMPFIFANEICDKLAMVGFHTNMLIYLTTQLHMPLIKAANTLTNFGGTASFTPLLGAFLADAFAGRFWIIAIASIIYTIGMGLLTLSAILPQWRPPPCEAGQVCQEANGGQLAILYVSLLLGALGTGGIRPCVVAFGADQFDERDPKQATGTWKYFNWYYFLMGLATLVGVTVIVFVQDNIGWGIGFGIPAITMFVSVIALLAGYKLYRMLKPAGSPFTRLLQVILAAYRKRHLPMVHDTNLLYKNEELDAKISLSGILLHTKQMKFLDKAAIVSEEDNTKTPNLWRLNTVHRVEELKSIIRMLPVWAAGILLITAYSQQHTFSLQQANTMDRHIYKSFEIPAGSMTVFTIISMLSTVVIYDQTLVPMLRKITGLNQGITYMFRMGIGFAISILATLVAGFIEMKRKHAALALGPTKNYSTMVPITVLWLVPQYSLHGVAEAFMSIGHLEFFYDQAPESMRSSAVALFCSTIAMGNYLSTFLVTTVHNKSNWLPNNINKGKLEYFYWLITLLQVVNFVYYLICAKFYTFKPLQIQSKDAGSSGADGVEITNKV